MADLLDTMTATLKLRVVEEGADKIKSTGDNMGLLGIAAKGAAIGVVAVGGALIESVKAC
jgi:hypothetical protein